MRVTRPLGWYTTTPEGVTLVGAGMNVFLAALKLVAGMVAGGEQHRPTAAMTAALLSAINDDPVRAAPVAPSQGGVA